LNEYLNDQDALKKFAFSMMIVKEMTQKHPYLKKVMENYMKE